MLINTKLLALLLLFVGLISAGPVERRFKSILKGEIKCAKKCTDSKNFNYQIGRSYRYDFETKNAFTPETGNSLNEVKITGHAKITVQSNCEHILKLENVHIEGALKDQTDKLVKELEANNLAYSFQDGEINTVCPLTNELKWTLNIKKAILSALQFAPKQMLNDLSTSNVDENDINGHCETVYENQSAPNADQYKLIKSKKLKTCSQRMSIDSAIIGNSALASELITSYVNMLVQSDHRCKMSIRKTGIVDSVKCTQSSDGPQSIKSDLRTLNEITLKFSTEEPVHYPQLTGEYYEDNLNGEKIDLPEEDESKVTSGQDLKNAIQNVCQAIANTLDYQSATKFRELVNAVKHSKTDLLKTELNDLLGKRNAALNNKHHNNVMTASTCCPHKLFKLYLEALISAKTDSSLKLLVSEIVPNNFYLQEGSVRAELKLISFYTSLAFYRNPTEDTLKSALPLLKLKGRHTRNALFGITGLARAICKTDPKCNLAAVNELANSVAEHIPSNCAVKPSNENQVVESLKALENLPNLPEPVLKKVISCLSASYASANVKVSVIKNLDGKTDQDLVKKAIKDVLFNANEQDEVRIQAYKRYRRHITKENAKEFEKLVVLAKDELASYIASDIQQIRDNKKITCPIMLQFREAVQDIDIKVSNQQGKSKRLVSSPLTAFYKSNLVVDSDVVYSSKTDKPISVISTFKLHHKEVLQIGLRSESGSNALLNIANVETIVDGIMQLVKSISAKQEDGKSRLVDEWIARIIPELANAFKDVDMFVKVGGRNLIYISKNDQQVAVGNRLDKLKLGLAPLLAMEHTSTLQVQSVSGMPALVRKDRTILSNYVLFDSQKVSDNEVKFEITPNLIATQLLRYSYPIGRYHNEFTLENEQYVTTNFGLKGRKNELSDKTEIRLKLNNRRSELLSHRMYNRIRKGESTQPIASTRKNRDLCLENIIPIKKMLGISVCSVYTDEEKSIVLEKSEDSNVLITIQKDKSGPSGNSKLIIEQENSPHKRKISVAISQPDANSRNLDIVFENPLGKGSAKVVTSKDKINIHAKLNDQHVYSLDAEKTFEKKNSETNFKAKASVSFPGLGKPFTSQFTAKVINDKKFHVSGELTVNEKNRLLAYEYNAEGKSNKVKRSADYLLKTSSDLKLFNMAGKTLLHTKHEGDYKPTGSEMEYLVEYPRSKTQLDKLEKVTLKTSMGFEHGAISKIELVHKFRSTQYPKLNFKYDHKYVHKSEPKKLEHYENDINIELDALGEGDDRKLRFGHVSTVNGMHRGSKKSSVDHLIRIVINKAHYNREITYNGNYELLRDNIYQINDKLKVQDISAAAEVLSASVSLKAEDPSATKLKLLVDYNCNKHGKFQWNEDINYDPKTRGVSTKIVLTVSRDDHQTVYNGEYTSSSDFWFPNSFELKLRKATDNSDVLHVKSDQSKASERVALVDYYGKRVFDFETEYGKDKSIESLLVKVASGGEIKYEKANTPEGKKLTYKLKLDEGNGGSYQQNAVLVCGKKILSFDFNIQKNDNKVAQFELFLSNPKKTLVTYRDVESGSVLLKNERYQASFKHDSQPTGFSSMLELQKLETKHKLVLMAVKDASKFALMTKLDKDGNSVYAFDSTYSKTTPSVINYKSEVVTLSLNVNPFGANDEDWKVLTLDIARKDGRYKHTSKINIKKLANKRHALAVKSVSSGKRLENNNNFEHVLDFQVSNDLHSLKLNAKISEADKADQLDYLHEFNKQDNSGIGFKLNHHFKLILQNELIFSHEMSTKLDQAHKLYEYSSSSEFKAKCPHINGVKLNLNGNCNLKDSTGNMNLKFDYPHKDRVIVATYDAKNSLKKQFMRELNVEVSNTKLKYKDTYLAKVNLISGLEMHFKFNKQSKEGHNLENLELRVLSKPEEHSLMFVAPLGWSGHWKFLPPNQGKMTFSTNLTKRGRVLFAVDSNFLIKKAGNRKRRFALNLSSDELVIHNVIGFNGDTKWAEEHTEITKEEVKYKFTSVFVNIDLNLKGLKEDKKTLYLKGCSAERATNCAVLEANIERAAKGAKAQGTFNYGLGEEAISVKFDYNRQKLDNGDNQGKLTGEMNGKQFTGEILVKSNHEVDIKLNLPERLIHFSREVTGNTVKYSLHPNMVKDKAHEHTLTITSNKAVGKKSHELVMIHPSFKRPLKLNIEVVTQKWVKIELDAANDEKKKLTLYTYKNLDGRNMKAGIQFFREDRKIDFGFNEERVEERKNNAVSLTTKRHYHWVDRNGVNQTNTRTTDLLVEPKDNERGVMNLPTNLYSFTLIFISIFKYIFIFII